jgi:hypothetical protein
MRVGLILFGMLALSGPIAAHAGQAGSPMGPAGAGSAPRFVQVGMAAAPTGTRTPVARAKGAGMGLAHIGHLTIFMAFGVRRRHGASHTLWSPTFPTATTVTGARCGIPMPNGEARTAAGVIPNAYR